VKVQIPWAHLEDSDLVPLGGTQEYVFVFLLVFQMTNTSRSEHHLGSGKVWLQLTPQYFSKWLPLHPNMLGGFCDLQIPGLTKYGALRPAS